MKCPTCDGEMFDSDHMEPGHHRPCPQTLLPLVEEYHAGASIRALADKHGTKYGIIRRRLIWGGANMRNEYPRRWR